jgi:superfamily II DNA or RNA helicase
MPRIFDNIKDQFKPALVETLRTSKCADFCVGYFNLRGWRAIDENIEQLTGGEGQCCRLLLGMYYSPAQEIRRIYTLNDEADGIDPKIAKQLQKQMVEDFRNQLMTGVPTSADEKGLQRLAKQLKEKKVIVKLFTRHPLHAKLYLLFRDDFNNPITGYVGSSNLTFAGLSKQGELNVDVLDQDACNKLSDWFEDRWKDKFCIDITDDLAEILNESWAREELIPPYHIYLKIAYHLAQEARAGMIEFSIPKEFKGKLFKFQEKAVQLAAQHVNRRGGVVIGDVVGLGKTIMATALAKVCQESVNYAWRTLIICPRHLVKMWEGYNYLYNLNAKILSISMAQRELPELRIYKLVIIDESHNLRNREGKRFRAIREYLAENESRLIMLTATPYNKTFLDLSNQLRLFIPEEKDIGIRPEHLIREIGEMEFERRYQCGMRTIAAFERSENIEDWRNLMRYYLVRRTRGYIMENYADTDPSNNRKYLSFQDGTRAYFPDRIPKTLKFTLDENDPDDQYARLYSENVTEIINSLNLPRYGLANYLSKEADVLADKSEVRVIENLARAGKRLMGFCRTHLFKRLESSGDTFLKSVSNHILRNCIYIYAIDNNLELPIGQMGFDVFDDSSNDEDADSLVSADAMEEYNLDDENDEQEDISENCSLLFSYETFMNTAETCYTFITETNKKKRRFKWIRSELFQKELLKNLKADTNKLIKLLKNAGEWDSARDTKLATLLDLINNKHPKEKILIFSQYADTVRYLYDELKNHVDSIEMACGDTDDPTDIAYRFSPISNFYKFREGEKEIRVVISTDVLSEGQNLQDAYIVLNYDLPWTIIRLVQRVGRVDRIGQKSDVIRCYSFLPADGIERILRLRTRVRARLRENGEVLGSDEQFFEDENERQNLADLYTENSRVLEKEGDSEVDLASKAYEIWRKATENNPELRVKVEKLPNVVFSTRKYKPDELPEGVVVYMRTSDDTDALAYIGIDGKSLTESPNEILQLAECEPRTPAIKRHEKHHEIVKQGAEWMVREQKSIGGQLGRPSGARFRVYERLKHYIEQMEKENSLYLTPELRKALDDIYRFPLRESARDILNRQLKTGLSDQELADLVQSLREDDKLTLTQEEVNLREPQIICSLGLFENTGE